MAEQVTLTPHGEPPRREMALGLTYLRAIELAGGVPVVVPPLPVEAITDLLANLHGVVLSGGPDIHPEAYGEAPHPELGPTWRDLDVTELALARLAIERELPMLAICRGAQALNIARGGTLFQHLPERSAFCHPRPMERSTGSSSGPSMILRLDSRGSHSRSPNSIGPPSRHGSSTVRRSRSGSRLKARAR